MQTSENMEKHLKQTPFPRVVEGVHRQYLKDALLRELQVKEQNMKNTRSRRLSMLSHRTRVAAVIVAAVVLVATGWAAERVVKKATGEKPKKNPVFTYEEKTFEFPLTPDGNWMFGTVTSSTMSINTGSDDEGSSQAADEDTLRSQMKKTHEQMKKLIAEKKYELVKTVVGKDGQKQYFYRFMLPDGMDFAGNFGLPLEKFDSWEDYVKERDKQEDKQRVRWVRRLERIRTAIGKGRYRLLDIKTLQTHICRDKGDQKDIQALRIERPDGSVIAFVQPYPHQKSPKGVYEMSWADHLTEIKRGNRKLIDLRVVKNYTYEITFDDGSKTIFSYGGDKSLEQKMAGTEK